MSLDDQGYGKSKGLDKVRESTPGEAGGQQVRNEKRARRSRSNSRGRHNDNRNRSNSRGRGRGRRSRSRSLSRSRSRSRSRGRYSQRGRDDRSKTTNARRDKSSSRSPPITRPRKKGMWDKAPPGYEGMNVAQVASLNPSVLTPLITPANTLLQSRQARRLYVGNVPLSASDVCIEDIFMLYGPLHAEVMDFFNAAMSAAKLGTPGVQAVVGCQMNHEKNYAFVEFRSFEDATAAMAFDGIALQNNILKVRRPKDYVAPVGSPNHPTSPLHDVESPTNSLSQTHIPGIVATNVQDSPYKVYLGGLPLHLSAEQVRELVSTFGQLKSFHLVMDTVNPAMSKGYAFLEYLDDHVTDRACEGLNGMQVGDKTILMHRANVSSSTKPPDLLSLPPATSSSSQTTPNSLPNLPSSNPLLTATLLGMPYMGSTTPPPPTSTLLLLNMASMDEIAQDGEHQALVVDVLAECGRMGPVKSVVIPRDEVVKGKSALLVKVYVHFESKEDAYKAHQTLGGRRYNGRTVVSHFVDSEFNG